MSDSANDLTDCTSLRLVTFPWLLASTSALCVLCAVAGLGEHVRGGLQVGMERGTRYVVSILTQLFSNSFFGSLQGSFVFSLPIGNLRDMAQDQISVDQLALPAELML